MAKSTVLSCKLFEKVMAKSSETVKASKNSDFDRVKKNSFDKTVLTLAKSSLTAIRSVISVLLVLCHHRVGILTNLIEMASVHLT